MEKKKYIMPNCNKCVHCFVDKEGKKCSYFNNNFISAITRMFETCFNYKEIEQ